MTAAKLSPIMIATLRSIAASDERGYSRAVNGTTDALRRRGLIEMKPYPDGSRDAAGSPFLGWGLTEEGRAVLATHV